MPYYEQFRKNSVKTIHKSFPERRHISTHDKKTLLVNSPIIIVVAIVLFAAFGFGIYKANEKNISAFIQSKTSGNLLPKDSLSESGAESRENRESFLKLPFKLFAKPEGDAGPVQEVTTDDGEDIVSTIIRQSALSYTTNDDGSYLSRENLRAFLPENQSSNFGLSPITNNFSQDSSLQTVNEETKEIETTLNKAFQTSEKTNAKGVNQNLGGRNEKIIEPKPFDDILSPENEKTKAQIVSSKPARTPRRDNVQAIPNQKTEDTKTKVSAPQNTHSSQVYKDSDIVKSEKRNVTGNQKKTPQKTYREEHLVFQTKTEGGKRAENNQNVKPNDKKETYTQNKKSENIINNAGKAITNNKDQNSQNTYIKPQENIKDVKTENKENKSNMQVEYKTNNTSKQNNNMPQNKTYTPQNKADEKTNIKAGNITRENEKRNVYTNENVGQSEKTYIEKYTEIKKNEPDTFGMSKDKTGVQNKSERENIVRRNGTEEIVKTEPMESAPVTKENNWKVETKKKTNNILKPRNIKLKPSIYLAEYDEKYGTITIVPRERNVGSDVSIETLLLSLLEGANENEYKNNIISCIAKNTSLLDVFTEGDTAYLNFSSDFEYNPLGDEGLVIQIYQIVYTVTQFENINKVIFLIDGEHKEMIGSEGRILNKPFTRNVDDTLMTAE